MTQITRQQLDEINRQKTAVHNHIYNCEGQSYFGLKNGTLLPFPAELLQNTDLMDKSIKQLQEALVRELRSLRFVGVVTVEVYDSGNNLITTFQVPAGGIETITVPDGTAVLEDTASNILSTTPVIPGSTEIITAPNATVENSDASYTQGILSGGLLTLPDSDLKVNTTTEGQIVSVKTIDVNLIDDTTATVTPTDITITGNTVTLEITPLRTLNNNFLFEANEDTVTFTIDANTEGTITSISDDGSSGTITIEVNSSPVSVPFSLVATDLLEITRTIDTADGFVTLTGTYT